ncbi:MAG: macB 1 [Gammaproteobacteria bacterium]|jgi:putative ABC transport system permease protein|nr:macB 1 [Gammaproteobacteria bacterium]
MEFTTHFQEALANLISAKLRSFLAVLGILVGTASVVAMVSSGELATQHALEQFEKLGTDLLSVSFYQEKSEDKQAQSQSFDIEQIKTLQLAIPELKTIAPYITLYQTISYAGYEIEGQIIAATPNLQEVIKLQVQQGRFISFLDDYEYYCFIGQAIYNQLQQQGLTNPIGARIALGDNLFRIAGVLAPWPENSFFNSDINRAIIIPIHTATLISQHAELNNLVIRFDKNTNIDQLQGAMTQYMKKISPNLRLFFRSPKQIINSMASQQRTFTLLLGLIGSISLLVGGIGVMNIMLVSVTERRREIGIRKAIGADRASILALFIAEAIILALFGGILGVIIGVLISFLIAYFAHWNFHFFILPPLIGFVVSVAVGIFFGFYPAHKAAKLDPIETLRGE